MFHWPCPEQLNKLYEHYMEHTAANFCYGPFGGVQGACQPPCQELFSWLLQLDLKKLGIAEQQLLQNAASLCCWL